MSAHRTRDLLLYGLALLAVVVLGMRWLGSADAAAPGAPPAAEPAIRIDGGADAGGGADGGSGAGAEPADQSSGEVVVHVAGAVRRPGVYAMQPGDRVDDAVRLAGGPSRRADLSALNLAAAVEDGRQILVPRRGRPATAAATATAATPQGATGAAAGIGGAGGAGGAGSAGMAADEPIDLNAATLEQLDTLDGVGPVTAQKILDAREAKGGFQSVEELGEISGIGEKRLAALRARVRV